MTKRSPAKTADQTTFEAALVIYGLDERGKPHAAAFAADEVELATRAASLMGLVVLPVTSDECRRLALSLPRGKIFSSGKALAPFIKRSLYQSLKALGGTLPNAPEPPPPDAFEIMIAAARPAASWDSIAIGEIVLAGEELSLGGGWWPALITELRPEQLVVLRWRDWPDLPAFPRRVADLGLLHSEIINPPAAGEIESSDAGTAVLSDEADHGGSDHAPAGAAG